MNSPILFEKKVDPLNETMDEIVAKFGSRFLKRLFFAGGETIAGFSCTAVFSIMTPSPIDTRSIRVRAECAMIIYKL